MVYLCEACGENGDNRINLKHGEGCKERFKVTKICMKSGSSPHVSKSKAKELAIAAMARARDAAMAKTMKPINSMCPVKKGRAIANGLTTTYRGKVIGFC